LTTEELMKKQPPANRAAHAVAYDPLLSVAEAAAYIDRHPETLRQAVREREIACVRNHPRGRMQFRLSVLNAWVKSKEQPARKIS
jgi:excisionase family DNA binding protein